MNLFKCFREKNNDHGFTLVELIVAIGVFAIVMAQVSAIVFNCSKLYIKGVEHVDMQADAQRVLQLTEELMIDATDSVSCVDSVGCPGSSDITIVTTPLGGDQVKYVISLSKTNPTDEAGILYLSSYDKDGNIKAKDIMAEGVESISCNMANYSTDDRVTVSVTMQSSNDKYEYASVGIKDIYLRNDIGSNIKDGDGGAVSGKFNLDVRRFAEYNLYDLYGSQYIYEFEPNNNDKKTDFVLTSGIIKCAPLTNESAGKETACVVNAYNKNKSGEKDGIAFTIACKTQKVRVGLGSSGSFNGSVVAYGNTVNSVPSTSFADVVGITLDPKFGTIDEDSCEIEFFTDDSNVSISPSTVDIGEKKNVQVLENGSNFFDIPFEYKFDPESDAYFLNFTNLFKTKTYTTPSQQYIDWIKNHDFYGIITVKYKDSSVKLQIKVYFSTVADADYVMPTEFFEGVKNF